MIVTMHGGIADSLYAIAAMLSLIIIYESAAKNDFFEYIENNKPVFVPSHSIEIILYVMSYVFISHGMYILSVNGLASDRIIALHISQLVLGIVWFIAFYNTVAVRASLILALFDVMISLYVTCQWYSACAVCGIVSLPYLLSSVLRLSINCRIVNIYKDDKTD